MANYTQANRPLAITTLAGKDALLLEKVSGTEAISELFQFRLNLLAERPVPFDKVLGQKATLTLAYRDQPKRFISGIINALSQDGRTWMQDGKTFFLRYQAELVPRLWLLTKRVQSRIFQHKNVPDILQQILKKDWQLDVQFQIKGTYPARDYCVQYHESDFDFVSRLMEDEGIFYYFTHTADSHTLVVSDTPNIHPEMPGRSQIPFDDVVGGHRDDARVTHWQKNQRLCACKIDLWDYSFELPTSHLEASSPIPASVPVDQNPHQMNLQLKLNGIEMLQFLEYPGGYSKRFDGINKGGGEQPLELKKVFQDNQRTVKIRMEQEAVGALTVEGTGTCAHFLPGHRFTLEKHFFANGSYLLTRVKHEANLEGVYVGTGDPTLYRYENRFEGIPLALAYRPPRVTAKPVIPGTQTAVVVGALGTEIFLDKYGRVKVQFHWDRQGKNDADSSCWIRVAQVWAGKGWGAHFWPRVGHEVVVSFEDGDPDQPLIVGSVYNAQNMPPWALPAESTVGGIKSCIFRGNPGANFNAVLFHDMPGQEYVQVHSESHEMCNSEQERYHYVHGTQFNFHGDF